MSIARLRTARDYFDSSGNPCICRYFARNCGDLTDGRYQSAAVSRIAAAPHGGKEPNPDLSVSRCVRSQKNPRCKGLKVNAVLRREEQPFKYAAAKSKPLMTETRICRPWHVLGANWPWRAGGRKPFAQLPNVDLLGNAQSIIKFNAKKPHRAVHFGVSKQKLNRAQVAGLAINLRCFYASHRTWTMSAGVGFLSFSLSAV